MKLGTPTQQHAEQAKRILARRARGVDTETKVKATADKKESATTSTPTVDTETKVPAKTNPYEGKDKKALRKLCEDRELSYKKKNTIPELIAILDAGEE